MNLSEIEYEVIRHKADGLTVKEIAAKIFKSVGYTDLFIHKLYQKCGVSNGPQLVDWAYRNGHLKINRENISDPLNKAG